MSLNKGLHENRVKGEIIQRHRGCDDGRTIEMSHHWRYYDAIMEAMLVSAMKNHDYAGGDASDPLGNFKRVQQAGVQPVIGLLVRMLDKVGRIETYFREGELKVAGEGLEDALMDLGNYCFLMLALLEDQKGNEDDQPG
jgi:hypothetical protein